MNYDNDYYGWIQEQAHLLKTGLYSKLDMENLVDEILSLGRSEKRRLKAHLTDLILHMLKKKYQPEFEVRSWNMSIKLGREQVEELLAENLSLKPHVESIISSAYERARDFAIIQSEVDEVIFPKVCIWSFDELMSEKV